MATVWVECWKCEACAHRWIKTETWPDQCASSKCRSRKWNASGAVIGASTSAVSAVEHEPVVAVSVMHSAAESAPVADLSALPVADRLAVARAALAKVSEPRGELLLPVGVVSAERVPCPYRDPPNEAGDIFGCGLHAGHKGRHVPGPKVGDIW